MSENAEPRGPFCRSTGSEDGPSGTWALRLLVSLFSKSISERFFVVLATGGLDGYAVSEMGDTSRDDGFREEVALGGALDGGAVSKSFLVAAFFLDRGLGVDELGSGVGKEALRPEDFALALLARPLVRFAV